MTRRGGHPGRGPRAAYASVYAPCTGRAWWWIAFICPHCGAGHLGRARTEEQVAGVRRTRCGRLVRVRVARVYRGRALRYGADGMAS
jgi:hypothetical protein